MSHGHSGGVETPASVSQPSSTSNAGPSNGPPGPASGPGTGTAPGPRSGPGAGPGHGPHVGSPGTGMGPGGAVGRGGHVGPDSVKRPAAQPAIDDSAARAAHRKAKIDCCKQAAKFSFTNIGLCLMIVGYSVGGGYMFAHLEQTNEEQLCEASQAAYSPMEINAANSLWQISQSYVALAEESSAVAEYQTQMDLFFNDVMTLGYDGRNCSIMGQPNGPPYQWNIPAAILFSVTVFTTVGYGNIAPKTFWGRLVCIAYAIVGIPLMLLALANIGEIMADIFRFVYSKICCCGCLRKRKPKGEDSGEGKNGNTPESWKGRYEAQRTGRGMQPNGSKVADDREEEDEEDDEERVSVPLTVTMSLIGGYLFMGSVLFSVWEGWDWLTSAYYCFITISTIGFGDVVPGSSGFDTSEDNLKMIGAALYMVFGMAILSMAFNLIQEEIISKFLWLGTKLGIIAKPKEEGDESEAHRPDHAPGQGATQNTGGTQYPPQSRLHPNSQNPGGAGAVPVGLFAAPRDGPAGGKRALTPCNSVGDSDKLPLVGGFGPSGSGGGGLTKRSVDHASHQ